MIRFEWLMAFYTSPLPSRAGRSSSKKNFLNISDLHIGFEISKLLLFSWYEFQLACGSILKKNALLKSRIWSHLRCSEYKLSVHILGVCVTLLLISCEVLLFLVISLTTEVPAVCVCSCVSAYMCLSSPSCLSASREPRRCLWDSLSKFLE